MILEEIRKIKELNKEEKVKELIDLIKEHLTILYDIKKYNKRATIYMFIAIILTFVVLALSLGSRESLDFFGVFGVVLFVVNSNNAITYLIKDKKHNDKEIKDAKFKLEVCEALLKEMQEQK